MTNRLPLNGFKVIDLTAHRAGPTAVRQLADWGADVIKIEPPGGAATDATGSRRDGPDFQNLHRNKRSLTLNLKSPEGLKIFFELAKNADVVVENYKSTVKHRLGVDYEAVKKVNPRIVYGSISGFGQDGPYEGRPGVDQIAQGMGGLMSITGHPGGGPVRVGIAINDTSAGLLLANGDHARAARARAHRRRPVGAHLADRSADLHARFPGGALPDEGRGRRAGGQQPSDRRRHRHVPDRRRLHQHRRLGRQACGSASARRPAHPSCSRDPDFATAGGALEEPEGAERAPGRDHPQATERLLGQR